jgi:hypothetical protein
VCEADVPLPEGFADVITGLAQFAPRSKALDFHFGALVDYALHPTMTRSQDYDDAIQRAKRLLAASPSSEQMLDDLETTAPITGGFRATTEASMSAADLARNIDKRLAALPWTRAEFFTGRAIWFRNPDRIALESVLAHFAQAGWDAKQKLIDDCTVIYFRRRPANPAPALMPVQSVLPPKRKLRSTQSLIIMLVLILSAFMFGALVMRALELIGSK